jgi:hypothetical protein
MYWWKKSKRTNYNFICVNSAGDKEQPLIINKSLRPRSFAKKNLATMGVD